MIFNRVQNSFNRVQSLVLGLFFSLLLCLFSQSEAAPSSKNILLICVDDLRPELNCFGKSYIHSPHIDALAARGRAFHRHYVQAPTCGASRYTLLTGTYGGDGNSALFQRGKGSIIQPSFPAFFRNLGYQTVSVGKVSHHPGGRGGADWDNPDVPEMPESWDVHTCPSGAWQHPRGWMHGLAHGEIRRNAKDMAVYQALPGDDTIYPDGIMMEEALRQLDRLGDVQSSQPFFLTVGILRPHLPFGAPEKYLERYQDAELPPIPHSDKPEGQTTWHKSGEFMKYNRWGRDPNQDHAFAAEVRRHYAACVTYADAQVGRLLARLDALQLRDDTIIILWGDHGWHLGERAVWGKHTLFEESLRSPLIISHPGMVHVGEKADGIVETIDIFPTVCELLDQPIPDYVDGQSLVPILEDPSAPGHSALSYRSKNASLRTDRYRLIEHGNGSVELYDFSADDGGEDNIASDHPELVLKLKGQLKAKLALR